MADDIRALSAILAKDPSSLSYVELAEALRRAGRREEALKVVMHGLGRHPQHADGYDCLGRIHADLGQSAEARWAWEKTLQIVPEHSGALRGVAFLYFKDGDAKRAGDALEHALAVDPNDEAARKALDTVRGTRSAGRGEEGAREEPAPPASPEKTRATGFTTLRDESPHGAGAAADDSAAARHSAGSRAPSLEPRAPEPRATVFDGLEGAMADILLLDARGLVLAGGLMGAGGQDVSELAAAALAGVSGEAARTAGYLDFGAWGTIVAEAETANLVLAEVSEGALLLVRRDRAVPVGLALRFAERARGAAATWLSGQGA